MMVNTSTNIIQCIASQNLTYACYNTVCLADVPGTSNVIMPPKRSVKAVKREKNNIKLIKRVHTHIQIISGT
jgi:hypothetical protein